VQQGRVQRGELLALKPVQHVPGRNSEVERFELLGDRVQPPERAAVVVFVMALDERDREIGEGPGTAMDLPDAVSHFLPPMRTIESVEQPSAWT
jgi:hypothetical protein